MRKEKERYAIYSPHKRGVQERTKKIDTRSTATKTNLRQYELLMFCSFLLGKPDAIYGVGKSGRYCGALSSILRLAGTGWWGACLLRAVGRDSNGSNLGQFSRGPCSSAMVELRELGRLFFLLTGQLQLPA